MTYITSPEVIKQIHEARDAGDSKRSVAISLELSYNTVRSWWNKDAPISQSAEEMDLKSIQCGFESHSGYHATYSYLLGVYLGDGWITLQNARYGVYSLRIEQDTKYPGLINEHVEALKILLPSNTPTIYSRAHQNSTTIIVSNKRLPVIFPQHGPGAKHDRPIVLEDWQQRIICEYPWQCIRGLYQTDGSRYVHQQNGYQYIKYNFTNRSKDIIDLFCQLCNNVGVRYNIHCRPRSGATDSSQLIWTVTIGKKQDVACCELHLGPKS